VTPHSALSELHAGDRVRVASVGGDATLVQRLAEFGLFEGEEIEFIGVAPLGDPIEIRIGETRLSLRKVEAAFVLVTPL